MSPIASTSDKRRHVAEQALAVLGSHRSEHQRLVVECSRTHHVAAVYETDAGLVYHARTGPHAHGSKDFIDTGRRGAPGGREYIDLLETDDLSDDVVPAWCACGPRSLSRTDLAEYVRQARHVVHVP